jgi:hypothetical protein
MNARQTVAGCIVQARMVQLWLPLEGTVNFAGSASALEHLLNACIHFFFLDELAALSCGDSFLHGFKEPRFIFQVSEHLALDPNIAARSPNALVCYDPRFGDVGNTCGFLNAKQLNRHYAEHGADFGAASPQEYGTLADAFLGGVKPAHVHECKRSAGDTVRFDPVTEAYGVLDSNGIIRTYFKPVPCSSVPAHQRRAIQQAGRCHGHPNNLLYFQSLLS